MSQLDNDVDHDTGPWNECSYECMAMALGFYGFKGDGSRQFGDYLERQYEATGRRRGSPVGMKDFMNELYGDHGIVAEFSFHASLQQVVDAIDSSRPVILHTDLTASGHVIAVNGYDLDSYRGKGALLCHDPNGEWFADGYRTSLTGEDVPYSFDLCERLMGPSGGYWMHQIGRR